MLAGAFWRDPTIARAFENSPLQFLDILVFLRLRTIGGSSWVLLKGTVTLILGLMFYLQWPLIARWASLRSRSSLKGVRPPVDRLATAAGHCLSDKIASVMGVTIELQNLGDAQLCAILPRTWSTHSPNEYPINCVSEFPGSDRTKFSSLFPRRVHFSPPILSYRKLWPFCGQTPHQLP
jgi:hypothetical protein